MLVGDTLYRPTLSDFEVYKSHSPENFQEALAEISLFCHKQLPKVMNMVFTPTCFDITQNEEFAVLGGEHGNIANLNLSTNRVLRDEEICYEVQVESVTLVLNDTQVVITNSILEVFLLDYPSFEILYKFPVTHGPISVIFSRINNNLYLSNSTSELRKIQMSVQDDFYTNSFSINFIQNSRKIYCLSKAKEGKELLIGFEDGKVGFFCVHSNNLICETSENSSPPILITVSEDDQLMAVAFEDNLIRVWDLTEGMTLKHEARNHPERITGLAFVRENTYLISSCLDKLIRVWNTKIESLPYDMNLEDLKVVMMKPGKSSKAVYYIHDTNELLIWRVPVLPINARYRHVEGKIIKVLFLQNYYELMTVYEDGQVAIWDFRNHCLSSTFKIPGPIIDAKLIYDGQAVLLSSSIPCMHIWDLASSQVETFELSFTPIAFEVSKNEALIAISDQFSRVLLHDFDVMIRKLYIKGHLQPVTCCIFIEDDTFLLTASRDSTLSKWNVNDGKRLATMTGHQSAVLHMLVSEQGYILSSSEDGSVIIWSIDCYFLYILVPPEKEPSMGIYLSSTHDYLITLQPTKVNYWQLQNLSLVFQTETFYPANSIALNADEKFVAVAEGGTVYLEENSIECSSLRIVGKTLGSRHRFMKFIVDCQVDSSKAQYDMIHNHWIVAPYLLGPAHILSYFNRFGDLDKALIFNSNRANFFSSRKNENPLTICVEMEFKNCIDICLKYMKIESQDRDGKPRNPRVFVPLESCLTKLNTIDYPYIMKLYDSLFIENTEAYLPRFCLIEAELPSTYLSERFTLHPENLSQKEMYSNTGRPVVFSQSAFPLDLDLGTYGSIKFLQSLLDCNDSRIFRSNIVKEYLDCKWSKIKPASYILGSIYICYLVMLALHIVVLLESKTFLAMMIFVHVILVFYEILQVATDFGDYWKSAWNILDQLRSISFSFYAIMAWENHYNTDILLAVLIFSWTRGISCFRMFDETRYMVRLIIQVIVDITYFFFILFYATLAFAFIYYIRNPDKSFAMYLTVAYRLDLGDFETNLSTYFDWGLFFVATMINPLIMLNLLIAIMSDTATAVDEIDDICGRRELTEMIIDIEKVMFWKKHLKHKHYLHKLDFFQVNDEETDKTMEKIRFIKKQVQHLSVSVKKIKYTAANLVKLNIGESLKEINEKHDLIKGEVKNGVLKSEELINGIRKQLRIKK